MDMNLSRRSLLAAVPSLAASAQSDPRPRAVLELFTSQGCSSCPPADRLAAELAQDPTLLVVSRPVDYWDRLGWRDSLAQHAFTERQEAYARIRGDDEVYTPQMVVDGRRHAVGSDRSGILELAGDRLPVVVDLGRDGVARVSGKAFADGATVSVWWLLRSRAVSIGRGENAHASVTYTNVVLAERPIGRWTGTVATFPTGPAPADADAMAVVVQSGSTAVPGPIRGGSATVSVA